MADRNKFPSGVPLTGMDFQFDGKARIEDRQRVQDVGLQTGVIGGFTCTVSGSSIMVAPGSGYTGDVDIGYKIAEAPVDYLSNFGTYVKTTSTKAVPAPAGGWNAPANQNTQFYVIVTMMESTLVVRPSEDGVIKPVRVDTSHQEAGIALVKVSDYAAYTDDQKHGYLKICLVKHGTGASPTAGELTNAYSIFRIKTAGRTGYVTGVEIINIASVTQDGDGLLTFVAPSSLKWAAPGDSYGALVSVAAGGSFTLYSSNVNYTMTVEVDPILLPITSQTDTINAKDLYEGAIRPASGADRLHRNYGGSGLKTITNPHGLTIDDIGGAGDDLTAHRKLMHATGIVQGSSPNFLLCNILTASGKDYISVVAGTSTDRFYVQGREYKIIKSSSNPVAGEYTLAFSDSIDSHATYEIYIDAYGVLRKNERIKLTTGKGIPGIYIMDCYLGREKEIIGTTVTLVLTADGNTGLRNITFNGGFHRQLGPEPAAATNASEYNKSTVVGGIGDDLFLFTIDWANLPLIPLPGIITTYTETYTFVNAPIDRDMNLVIGNVVGSSGTQLIGMGYKAAVPYKGVPLDQRGKLTLGLKNLGYQKQAAYWRNDAPNHFLSSPYLSEQGGGAGISNGVWGPSTNVAFSASPNGAALTIKPGVAFIRGQIIPINGTVLTFSGDADYHVFVDLEGNYYVFTKANMNKHVDFLAYTCYYMLLLYTVTVSGGIITVIIDDRVPPGVPGGGGGGGELGDYVVKGEFARTPSNIFQKSIGPGDIGPDGGVDFRTCAQYFDLTIFNDSKAIATPPVPLTGVSWGKVDDCTVRVPRGTTKLTLTIWAKTDHLRGAVMGGKLYIADTNEFISDPNANFQITRGLDHPAYENYNLFSVQWFAAQFTNRFETYGSWCRVELWIGNYLVSYYLDYAWKIVTVGRV